MKRRHFLAALAAPPMRGADLCGCAPAMQASGPLGAEAFKSVGSKLRITGMKVFGVSLTRDSDRPYVFVKLETNQGLVGWGEGTLEGKAAAVMACVEDFREFLIGSDPMQVEHLWQSMYVHSFYRAGPVIGSAISGIDQALWDIRGKALGKPVYKLLGGPMDPRGVRGYYHARANNLEQLRALRSTAKEQGVTCFKSGIPGYYEWIETHRAIRGAVKSMEMLREGLGPDIDIGVDFHAKTSPSVASVIIKEVEPLHLLFVEEPCPPENVKAMAKIARRSTTPIATGERLVSAYNTRELIEMGVVDILQTDINHVGGITALWKSAAVAEQAGISMAPHACEGPIGGLATIHVDAAMPNFVVQEICSGVTPGMQEKVWAEWFGFPAMRMVDGRFPLPEKPGLGFELSEDALKEVPIRRNPPHGAGIPRRRFSCRMVILVLLINASLTAQTPQNPSPMVENRRAHGRITKQEPAGKREALSLGTFFLPAKAKPKTLLFFFHGGGWLPETAAAKRKLAVVSIQIGAGSGVYSRAFTEPDRFLKLVAEVESKAGRHFDRVLLGGWSAGNGAIRSILRDAASYDRVAGVISIDGIHADYVKGKPNPENLDIWLKFARDAVSGRKQLLITHTEIYPGTYASTTETADWLLAGLGIRAKPVLRWGPMGTQQISEAKVGKFLLRGYAGNSAPDHVDLLHSLGVYLGR